MAQKNEILKNKYLKILLKEKKTLERKIKKKRLRYGWVACSKTSEKSLNISSSLPIWSIILLIAKRCNQAQNKIWDILVT